MADKKTKKQQTVRERTQAKPDAPKAHRRAATTTAKAGAKPFQLVWQGLKIICKPFGFLLWPFKTRPARFIGRILAKVLFINYFKSAFKELKDVTWPNRKETTKLTVAVLLFAIVFGAVVAILDYGLDKLFHKILVG